MTRSLPVLACLLALLSVPAACGRTEPVRRAEFYVFGTLLEVSIGNANEALSDRAFSDLQQMFQRMHRDWHAWEPGLLTGINEAFAAGRPARADEGIVTMLRRSQEIERASGGRFNPAIGAVIDLWGFHTSEFPIFGAPPAPADIDALLAGHPSTRDIRIDDLTLTSDNRAVQLDLGGIAKGYAIDRAVEHLRALGVHDAIVNAGGDLRTLGSHGERPWRIAIRDPGGGIIGSLEAGADEAIFTSGNYERFRQDHDRRYPHILDPRTGRPVTGLASATVIAEEGLLADAAATALIVAGPDEWRKVAQALGLREVLVVSSEGRIFLTPPMQARVELTSGVQGEIVPLDGG